MKGFHKPETLRRKKEWIGNNKTRQFQNARGAQGPLCCRGSPGTTRFTSWAKGVPCPWPPRLLGGTRRIQLLRMTEAVLPPHPSPHAATCSHHFGPRQPACGLDTSRSPAAKAAAVHEVVLCRQEACSQLSRDSRSAALKETAMASRQPLHPGGEQAFWQVFAVLGDY